MTVERSLEERRYKSCFKNLNEDDIDYNTFHELIVTQEHLHQAKLDGEITVKILEGCLESYWQVLIMTILYCQPSFDGILNRSFVGLDLILVDKERATLFFLTYIFWCF